VQDGVRDELGDHELGVGGEAVRAAVEGCRGKAAGIPYPVRAGLHDELCRPSHAEVVPSSE
jgi:hypothetical protein